MKLAASDYFSELDAELTGGSWNGLPFYRLLKPLMYCHWVNEDGECLTVPVGFITDFASIPKGFRDRLPAFREYAPAAVVHDYLYTTHNIQSRLTADRMFLKAMKDCGTPLKGRLAMFLAVRLFGRGAWKAHLGWDPKSR